MHRGRGYKTVTKRAQRLNGGRAVRWFCVTKTTIQSGFSPCERRARFHRRLVLMQLAGIGVLAGVLAQTGLGTPALVCWLGVVGLMVCSMAVQVWWQLQDSPRIPPTRFDISPPGRSGGSLCHALNSADGMRVRDVRGEPA